MKLSSILTACLLMVILASGASADWEYLGTSTPAWWGAATSNPTAPFAERIRWGSTGAAELYLGRPDLGNPANRLGDINSNWSGTSKTFSFAYGNTGLPTGSLAGTAAPCNTALCSTFTPYTSSINAIFMSIRGNVGNQVDLNGMTVGGTGLANVSRTFASANQTHFYRLLTTDFTIGGSGLMGSVLFTNGGPNQERPVVDLYASTVPEPGFYGALTLGLGGLFLALRRRRRD